MFDSWLKLCIGYLGNKFEDVLLMDSANRNIGDKVLVDVNKLKKTLTNINPKTTMAGKREIGLLVNEFCVDKCNTLEPQCTTF